MKVPRRQAALRAPEGDDFRLRVGGVGGRHG